MTYNQKKSVLNHPNNRLERILLEDGISLSPAKKRLVGAHSNKHSSNSKKSLSVDPDRNIYYCFSCKEGGNTISWLTNNRGYSYSEAMDYLAARAGVSI